METVKFFDKETEIFPDVYLGGNTNVILRIRLYPIATNMENTTNLVGWTARVKTSSNYYITSAKQHRWWWDESSKAMYANGTGEKPITFYPVEGQADVNTDISDDKVIAEGVFEVPWNYDADLHFKIDLTDAIIVDVKNGTGTTLNEVFTASEYIEIQADVSMGALSTSIKSANNFTDEENIDLNYAGCITNITPTTKAYGITDIKCYLSLDGYSSSIIRTLPIVGKNSTQAYTVFFTDEELEFMRQTLANEKSREVFLFVENEVAKLSSTGNYVNSYIYDRGVVKRSLTIVNGEPILVPTVKDTNATTLALTGNENTIVRYHSNAYVKSDITLQKHAGSVKSHLISVGSRSTTAYSTTFNAVENDVFTFSATDSRGFNTTIEVKPPYINYVKLTCGVKAEPVEANTGILRFTISGNYYNGGFGAINNNLGLIYRLKRKQDEWGDWVNVSNVSYNGNTYTVDVAVSGLNYQETFELQAGASDRLNVISTPIQTLTTVPVFDWGQNDFNFNVPVGFSNSANFTKNIEVDGAATFNGTTNLEGSTNLEGTTNINGSINFNSDEINFNEGLNLDTTTTTFDGNTMADYIVATGTEAMGSNGTWKWEKWASGKAECWGRRNYGNTGFGTPLIQNPYLFMSDTFDQDLPNIFNAEPDVVDISVIKSNDANITYMWVVRNGSATSGSTGDFALVKSTATVVQQLILGFHVIGTWK